MVLDDDTSDYIDHESHSISHAASQLLATAREYRGQCVSNLAPLYLSHLSPYLRQLAEKPVMMVAEHSPFCFEFHCERVTLLDFQHYSQRAAVQTTDPK